MIHKKVDDPRLMWAVYESCVSDLFLTTANSTENVYRNTLVMGAGHAKQMRDRFKGVDKAFLSAISRRVASRIASGEWEDNLFCYAEWNKKYYRIYGDWFFLVSEDWPKKRVGAFQVKRGFWMRGNREGEKQLMLQLIAESCRHLIKWCNEHPECRVDMPFPGIGNGGLDKIDVMGLVEELPDTVYVWEMV